MGIKKNKNVEGIICTIDLLKNEVEVKIMFGCDEEEINVALRVLKEKYMRAT